MGPEFSILADLRSCSGVLSHSAETLPWLGSYNTNIYPGRLRIMGRNAKRTDICASGHSLL
jgi:hypothetical protein